MDKKKPITSRANTLFQMHKDGKRLSASQRCLAKCADCTNQFADGREDCGVISCPIHPIMPYRIKNKAVGHGKSSVSADKPVSHE